MIVVDLGFGDAGKGTIVDWLAGRAAATARPARSPTAPSGRREFTAASRFHDSVTTGAAGRAGAGPARATGQAAFSPGHGVSAVLRFNGGAQAAHTVVRADGRAHTFAQFGAGTFAGVPTLLTRHMLVEPLALAREAAALAALGVPYPLDLVSVDRHALITTPLHAAVNRAREVARGDGAHGSCGIGVGETAAYALNHPDLALRAGDTESPSRLRRRLLALRDWAGAPAADQPLPDVDELIRAYRSFGRRIRLTGDGEIARLAAAGRLIFEGAQGVLLDEWRGFHPHTTWSTTTFANALELLSEAGVDRGDACRLGVTRTYATRHGAGPFPSEDPALAPLLPEPHNGTGRWQGAFRVGHLDLVLLRYALEVCGGADALAVTHLDTADRARDHLRVATAWRAGGTRITRLRPGPFKDLAHQQRLTDLAHTARPELTVPGRAWDALLADALGLPVAVTSHGPRSGDKQPATVDEITPREDQERAAVS